ncbi:hypothetical protein SADUNF_Sadunf04G0155200 [Salix dunnii]|uniref:Replication factor A C-terminal domain-containing protein n=1 Tax=Salix dunnii TaxID=1413687 RepID=A0A835KFA7_9ROSI|nr:hypothetical protein SADUNF_Sadunf04G0155200 [Salix dunnii]
MEYEKATTVICTVIGMDYASSLSYRACSLCERTLPDTLNDTLCKFCPNNAASSSSRLFRILVSIATDTKVLNVMCFDRAARVLFGCSADDFFHFSKLHPFAASNAAKILEGEMFRMTLSRPKNGNAQHLRAVSIVPLRSGFKPAIESLKEFYGVKPATS